MSDPGIVGAIIEEATGSGQDLAAWGVAWARVLPTVLFVPAFGMDLLSVEVRVAMGLALAAAVVPAVGPEQSAAGAWPLLALHEFARGVPVAISASVSLFAASVAGAVADTALGRAPILPSNGFFSRPFAMLFGLLAAALFLQLGGAERVAAHLAFDTGAVPGALGRAVFDLAAGIDIGASIGAPVLVVALVFDVAAAIVVRDLPALGAGFFAPLRALVVLVGIAALLDRMAEAIALKGSSPLAP